ncbi:MAG: hypothetical protein LBK29_02455 [Oscillospiraceae bacterium]|jgi:hypothetical protein|nr:hypothetical protein [Oscillospiraceae bacterium]
MGSNFCCCQKIETKKTFSNNVIFVPDEKITIDSQALSETLDTRATVFLSKIPLIGHLLDYFFSSPEKNRLCFVKPNKYSDNPLEFELFPEGSPKPEDVLQGHLGLCYFFAVLSTVAERDPNLIKTNMVEDNEGNVSVKFFDPSDGNPFYIKVQKTVPELPKNFKFVYNNCLWVQIYLKAFIASQFSGLQGYILDFNCINYKYAEGGLMDLVIRMITGKETETSNALSVWLAKKNDLYSKIEKTLSDSGYVTCDFASHLNVIKLFLGGVSNEGLVRGHAYSIEKVYKDKNGQRWIIIRNPWGYFSST